jgi:hypothetical protein
VVGGLISAGERGERLLLLSPAPLFGGLARSACGVPREHLLELLVQPALLEEGALLAPDLVRNVGRLRRSSSVKTCAGWPFFSKCIVVGGGR